MNDDAFRYATNTTNEFIMKKITHFISAAFLLVSLAQLTAAEPKTSTVDPLEQGFLSPPESTKPKTWWHWMSGCVSREGSGQRRTDATQGQRDAVRPRRIR